MTSKADASLASSKTEATPAAMVDRKSDPLPVAKGGKVYAGQSSGSSSNQTLAQSPAHTHTLGSLPAPDGVAANVHAQQVGTASSSNSSPPGAHNRSNPNTHHDSAAQSSHQSQSQVRPFVSHAQGHAQGQGQGRGQDTRGGGGGGRGRSGPSQSQSYPYGASSGRGYPAPGGGYKGGRASGGFSGNGNGSGSFNPSSATSAAATGSVNPLGNPRAPYGGLPAPRSGAHLMSAQSGPTSNSAGTS